MNETFGITKANTQNLVKYGHSIDLPTAFIPNDRTLYFPNRRHLLRVSYIHQSIDAYLDDRFHETGIDEARTMEPEVCWRIPRLRRAERGETSWQHGDKHLRWR
jgi:hypothetical protein